MNILLCDISKIKDKQEANDVLTQDACQKIINLKKIYTKLCDGDLVVGFDDQELINDLIKLDFRNLTVKFAPTKSGRICMILS